MGKMIGKEKDISPPIVNCPTDLKQLEFKWRRINKGMTGKQKSNETDETPMAEKVGGRCAVTQAWLGQRRPSGALTLIISSELN